MRIAPVLAALLIAAPALAQPEQPAPAGEAPPQNAAPGETPPIAPPSDEPKVDPAYGERPNHGETSERAPGDQRHLSGRRKGREIVVRYHPDRSKRNMVTLASMAGAGVLIGAVGVYFHVDARSASDEVSARNTTGLTWSAARQDTYERAESSSTIAGVAYGIGGALLLATAVAYIVTEPEMETKTIHPHEQGRPIALVAPTPGGALLGGAWRF